MTGKELKAAIPVACVASFDPGVGKHPTTSEIPDDATVTVSLIGDDWTSYTASWGGGDDIDCLGAVVVFYHHPRLPNLSLIPCRVVGRQSPAHLPSVRMVWDHPYNSFRDKPAFPQAVLAAEASIRAHRMTNVNLVV